MIGRPIGPPSGAGRPADGIIFGRVERRAGPKCRPIAAGPRSRRHLAPWRRALLVTVALLALLIAAYGLSPYVTLWRLERAIARNDAAALAGLVDLAAVRTELRRRVDKTQPSLIGELSAPFIDWLAETIRTPEGRTLAPAVSLTWLHGLLAPVPVWTAAGFRRPTLFCALAPRPAQPPVNLCLGPALPGWRVVAAWY